MLRSETVEASLLLSAFVNMYLYVLRLRVLLNQVGASVHNYSMLVVAISN